jgi:hypothetical protein
VITEHDEGDSCCACHQAARGQHRDPDPESPTTPPAVRMAQPESPRARPLLFAQLLGEVGPRPQWFELGLQSLDQLLVTQHFQPPQGSSVQM